MPLCIILCSLSSHKLYCTTNKFVTLCFPFLNAATTTMRRLLLYTALFTAMLNIPGYGHAQTTGKISGTVTDSLKKPLPFVTVRFFKQNNLHAALQTTLS